jgi:hypothetical protein
LRELVAGNRAALADVTLAGTPLNEVARDARQRLVADATRFTAAYLGEAAPSFAPDAPLVVSGHQPELFHPGVWFKNFALDQIARTAGASAVHLLIDSDLCRGASVRVPGGSIATPRWDAVAYDALGSATPYEERRVLDPTTFERFPDALAERGATLGLEPMAEAMWPTAIAAAGRHGTLGRALSEARHAVESRWGLRTLELPLAEVCDTPSFARFALELASRADDFRTAYNSALADYRRAHRIRNAAQPLPDLHERQGWTEVALWVWRDISPVRRPLWVRRVGAALELSDGADWRGSLAADSAGALDQLAALRRDGVKLRSRALTTTLYARLVLADLFLHGIGGAKYDEVTDALAARFFGFTPPPHATLTATLRLPIARPAPGGESRDQVIATLRALRYHPERFADELRDDAARALVGEKRRLVSEQPARGAGAPRRAALDAVNRKLADRLAPLRAEAESRIDAMAREATARSILDSREVPFPYFPAEHLRRRLTEAAGLLAP